MTATATSGQTPIRWGLRANLAQFSLLVTVNALVGGTIGQERTVLPLLTEQVFAVGALTASLTFIVAFGSTKALTNLAAGSLSDRYGRKPVLIAGWLIGLPVPLMLIWAPSWGWVIAANILLGINQGLTWSTTIVMKIDLVGPARRGMAMVTGPRLVVHRLRERWVPVGDPLLPVGVGGEPIQRAVGSVGVVLDAPVLGQYLNLQQG